MAARAGGRVERQTPAACRASGRPCRAVPKAWTACLSGGVAPASGRLWTRRLCVTASPRQRAMEWVGVQGRAHGVCQRACALPVP